MIEAQGNHPRFALTMSLDSWFILFFSALMAASVIHFCHCSQFSDPLTNLALPPWLHFHAYTLWLVGSAFLGSTFSDPGHPWGPTFWPGPHLNTMPHPEGRRMQLTHLNPSTYHKNKLLPPTFKMIGDILQNCLFYP